MPIKVIIADDHETLRDELRAVLEESGDFTVLGEAGDGEEAVKLVERLDPDVVVMDVAMPGVSGIEATRRIRAASARSKVLALSMHSDNQYVQGMLNAGACGYMLKDRAAEELAEALHAVMSDRTYMSPGLMDSQDCG